VYTSEAGGRFVNVTTLPMVELGAPLYRIGGYRLALLLPIAGCVAAAFAARGLARRLGGSPSRCWLAYWLIALGSPLVVYALDFWEHTIGVALVLWGVVALIDAANRFRPWLMAPLAGLAFGAAFSMRTESLVYGFVATVLAVAWLALDRDLGRALIVAVGTLAGLVVAVAANLALEQAALGTAFRTERASGTAGAGGDDLVLRLKEGALTTLGIESNTSTASLVMSAVVVGLLALLLAMLVRRAPARPVAVTATLLGALVLARVADGFGFVPGFLAAAPFAVLGLVVAAHLWPSRPVRYTVGVAVLSLPLVWAFQFTGGAGPQWGGRYVLVSAVLLTVVGVVGLDQLPRRAAGALLAAAVAVSWFGVAWLVVRSHEVADAAAYLRSRTEPAVISTEPFWLRELADDYDGSRWLSVRSRSELDRAASVVSEAGFDRFALVEARPPAAAVEVPGFEPVSSETREWLDAQFRISTYERTS
jgi:hypothetical protein